MSRNKAVLIIILAIILYFVTPNDGVFQVIKANCIAALPFIMIGIIIYLIFTINALKRAWRKLDASLNDENTINFSKIMNITFDVKRMLGPANLMDLYRKVNFSPNVSMDAKRLLYQAMRRKKLDVAPPGKSADIDAILNRSQRTAAEIKAARIEAASRKKKAHRK